MKKVIFILLLFVFYTYPFKLNRVILSTNNNPDYIEFWPIVAKAWKEIIGITPTLALIGDETVSIDASLGDVIQFNPIEGVPTSLHAQCIRLLLPCFFNNDICILSDIDMIPLNKNFFFESIKQIKTNQFAAYSKYPNTDRFPICYMAAKGSVFRDIFLSIFKDFTLDLSDSNILLNNTLLKINISLIMWNKLGWGWDTDELVLSLSLKKWNLKTNNLINLNKPSLQRITKECMHTINESNIHNYVDFHCPRPYSKYKQEIDTIFEYALNAHTNKKL